jgi:hypothetical protein
MPAGYVPPPSKPLPPATQYLQLYTKKLLADSKQGAPLTNEENAQLQAAKATMDEAGVSRMDALGRTYAQYHISPVTDESGAVVDIPIAAIVAAYKAGTPYSGAVVGSPTGTDKRNQMLAQSGIQQVNRMLAILNKDPNLTGPGAGQLTALQTWLGTQDPDAQAFLMSSLFASEHGVAVFGGRNIHTISDLQNTLGAWKNNPAALRAALGVMRETMTPWLTAGGRLPGRTGQGGGAPGTHKVGDPIMQGGHKFKVTAVDANGKVTAADPVP